MTTLNSKNNPAQFDPALHAKGPIEVTHKGQRRTIPGLVRDLQTVKLRRRLDNPHNVEWTNA